MKCPGCKTVFQMPSILPSGAATPSTAPEYLTRAEDSLDKKEYDGSIAHSTEAIRIEPENALAYGIRAVAYLNRSCVRGHSSTQDMDCATADLVEVHRLNPKYDFLVYGITAELSRLKQDYDRAITDATEAIRLDPNHAIAYATRAATYRDKKDYDQAVTDATKAIRLNPKYAFAHQVRAEIYWEMEDYDRSIVDATEAIRLAPKDADTYCIRAMAYWGKAAKPQPSQNEVQSSVHGKDEFDLAIVDATEAIRLNPEHDLAYFMRAQTYWWKNDDYGHSIADVTECIRLLPEFAPAYSLRAMARLRNGDISGAATDATEAIRLDPTSAESYGTRATAYLRKGDIAGAISDATEAIRLNPQNELARLALHDATSHTPFGRLWFDGKLFIKMLIVVGLAILIVVVIEMIGRLHPLAAVVVYGIVVVLVIYLVKRAKSKAQNGEGWFCDRSLSDFADTVRNMPIEGSVFLLVSFLVVLFGMTAAYLGFICKGLNEYQPDVFIFSGNTVSASSWFWYGIELQLHTMVPFVEWRQNVIQLSDIEPQGESAGKVVGGLRWAIAACNLWILFCAYKVVRSAVKSAVEARLQALENAIKEAFSALATT